MRWFHVVAKICKSLGLYHLILDRENNEPYLHRYYLLNTRWLDPIFPKLSYRLVLHNCVKSDIDGLHDHPWDWKSMILEGGYWETLPIVNNDSMTEDIKPQKVRRIWRGPGNGWRSCKSTDYHRLELPHEGAECWSLFLMGPRKKDWGFQDRNGNWVRWDEYINNREKYI